MNSTIFFSQGSKNLIRLSCDNDANLHGILSWKEMIHGLKMTTKLRKVLCIISSDALKENPEPSLTFNGHLS